jgi:CDP-diglyceride synthetase
MAFIRIFTYFQYVNKGKDPHEELTGQRVYALIALVIIGDLFALVYVTVFYSCAGSFIRFESHFKFFFFWAITGFQCDNGALWMGKAIGKTPFASLLSPTKTWEGVAGAFLVALLTNILFNFLSATSLDFIFLAMPRKHAIVLTFVVRIPLH